MKSCRYTKFNRLQPLVSMRTDGNQSLSRSLVGLDSTLKVMPFHLCTDVHEHMNCGAPLVADESGRFGSRLVRRFRFCHKGAQLLQQEQQAKHSHDQQHDAAH
jgi:hypothetical protein